MRILVTGSAGFIGTHLTEALFAAGHEVYGVDIVIPIGPLGSDMLVPGAFAHVVQECAPEMVVHLAAQVGRLFGEDDVRHTITSNAVMTAIVGTHCGARGIPVLYASSSEVYGDQGDAECFEDGALVPSHNLYGVTKRWGEEVLRLYVPEGLRICRLSMPYGPGAPPGRGRRAMDNMLWQAHHGMPIAVHRGAERSWCWVKDTVGAIALVAESAPGVYNIGRDDDPRPMLELAEMACAIAGASTGLIDMVDPPNAQTVVKRLSTAKVRALGWAPTVDLPIGMALTYEWIKRFDREGNLT